MAATPHHASFSEDTTTRQHLTLVALGKRPADRLLQGVRLLNVFTLQWLDNWDIVISGERIAWTGPSGEWRGEVAEIVPLHGLSAVPGFGESHKHIESTHLTPEYEAALVLPDGNTWTVEASHEFSNVDGRHNVEFWLTARRFGNPLKIFPAPGSATPPTAFEQTGGYHGYQEMKNDFAADLRVPGLDEVMDWTAVWDPTNPGYERLWQAMQATWEARGVVEGHGAGLRDLGSINAFAAAGLSSDHEAYDAREAWDKVSRGIFLMLRPIRDAIKEAIPYFLEQGIKDWSNLSLTTDDRDAGETLKNGGMDYNVRCAIEAGAPVEAAYAMASYYPARHWHLEHLVGSIAPGRYADVVLLSDPATVKIKEVYADGKKVAEGENYLPAIPKIDWPDWATKTMNIGRAITAADFRIDAPAGKTSVTAALLEPYYFEPDFLTTELPVAADGSVERAGSVSKFAIVDRYHGNAGVAKMFWQHVGPKTPNSALACSVAHDHHNIWVLGSGDEAMAMAVNAVADMQGGWALVNDGKVVKTVCFEVGGLMTARTAQAVTADLDALYAEADKMEWFYGAKTRLLPNTPGLPKRMVFATLTCTPWHWVLVAPTAEIPNGFVNVTTGASHPVVW